MRFAPRGGRRAASLRRAVRASRGAIGVALLSGSLTLRRGAAWIARATPAVAAGLAAAIPVLRSTAHAVSVGWQPAGDDGIILTRGWDVLTTHSPLVGQYSEASALTGQIVHSPGPLLYWLIALPARLFSVPDVAAWMGACNTLAIIGAVALARRRGGLGLMFVAAAAIALMCQSLPSESFHDVWNPAATLFPFLLLVFLCWSLACGDHGLAPLTVAVASFVTQTHLTYLAPTLAMLAVAAACALAARVRRQRAAPASQGAVEGSPPRAAERRPAARARRVPRWLLATIFVAGVCWAPPALDELERSPGNLSLIQQATTHRGATLGSGPARTAVVRAVGLTPWWLEVPRSEWIRKADVREPPGAGASASAVVILLALALTALAAVKRRRRDLAAAALIALSLCAALAADVSQTPQLPLLAATVGYTLWWASIVGMWSWLVLAYAVGLLLEQAAAGSRLARRAAAWKRAGRSRLVVASVSIACLAGVAGTGAAVAATERRDSHAHQYRPIAAIVSRLDEVLPGGVVIRYAFGQMTVSTQPMEPAIRFGLVRHGDLPLSNGSVVRLGEHYELRDKPYSWLVLVGDGRRRRRRLSRVVTVSFEDGFGHSTFSAWVARVGPGGKLSRPRGLGPATDVAFGSRIG